LQRCGATVPAGVVSCRWGGGTARRITSGPHSPIGRGSRLKIGPVRVRVPVGAPGGRSGETAHTRSWRSPTDPRFPGKDLVCVAMVRIRQWPYTFAMALSILVGAVAVFSSLYLDLPLRDPDGFLGPSYIRLPVLALAFVGVGIFVQALRRSGGRKLPTTMVEVARQEWNLRRALYTTAGLLSFYVCYVSYRNR